MTRARKKMTERERFEKWAGNRGYLTDGVNCYGMYDFTTILNDLWECWQTAKRDAKRNISRRKGDGK